MATKEALEKWRENLMGYPNVQGVGLGNKVKDGEETDEEAVVVMVSKKKSEDELSEQDILPKTLENGVKTDVIEVGIIRPEILRLNEQGESIDTTKRHRPVFPGLSISHPSVTAGTEGCILFQKRKKKKKDEEPISTGIKGIVNLLFCPCGEVDSDCALFKREKEHTEIEWETVGLSNNHVIANGAKDMSQIGKPVFQPGTYDGGNHNDSIGQVIDYTPIHDGMMMDEGIHSINKSYEREIPKIGLITDRTKVKKGMAIEKFGRTTKYTSDKVKITNATVRVNYGFGRIKVRNTFLTGCMSSGGDSGSLGVKKGTNKAIGLLFAGSNKVTVYCDINTICKEHNLHFSK